MMNFAVRMLRPTIAVFLMMAISHTYAQTQQSVDQIETAQSAEDYAVAEAACVADEACDVASEALDNSNLSNNPDNSCTGIENCTVVAASCNEGLGVDACNVDSEPAVQSNKITRKYMENGCEVTEYEQDAVMDCSMRDKQK